MASIQQAIDDLVVQLKQYIDARVAKLVTDVKAANTTTTKP